ncbi:MAG TPA: serine/threonine-protein kinase [Kouleothrix sp.]|uniref:serine/threonine-protein kinase n=1 Tax=Kouleothrix sp. TaxID=2779161 RepID=UPI002BC87CC9|nr:serine/threonine-protein kinase [Kouleothrix sp.]HRC76569.1 serine/threonine-protein kinase [Kouleothrix sp.]
MSDLIDTRLNQYHLIEIVRRGGMSTVYKAYQDSLDRFVAVKVLSSNRDPQFAARFKREARAIAALQHHNILPVYDFGEQGALLFLVLQYVENGNSLADMLGRPMQPVTALRLTSHVLDALDYAHKRGIIHRDIKPGNVLMPSPSWPMLADFGIAKLMNDNQRLTLANQIIGTAAYMAPEQATGRPIDARTDLYAAGVVLYELVTGRVPFDSDTPMAVLTKHVYDPPPPARTLNPDLSPLLEALLDRALAKEPAARFQTAAEMSAALLDTAAQLEVQQQSRVQMTGLYELGLDAFQSRRYNEAVSQLRKLVDLDPENEDANELLQAALDAQERARHEAQQRANQVGQPAIPPPPPLRAANPTVRLPQLDEAPPRPIVAGPAVSQTAPTTHMPAPPLPEAPAEPEQDIEKLIAQQYQQYVQQYTQPPAVAAPARERSVTIAWVIAGVVVLALLVALFVLLR